MIIIFGLLLLLMIVSIKVHWKGIDLNYLSKKYTLAIKGIFVVIVFLSHVRTYSEFSNQSDLIVIQVLNYLGQLMVALFLFYSGYGVFESIKRKGDNYIDSFPKNRILKTFFDFSFSLVLFLILDFVIGKRYSLSTIILSFIGWTSIGNSAWYMFAIFTLYLGTYFIFKIFKSQRLIAIFTLTIYSLCYVYILSLLRDNYWSSTYLCYIAGVWYSYFKEKIDTILTNNILLYYISVVSIICSYIFFFKIRYQRLMMFNLVAILFCLLFVVLSMKISFKSKILIWFGKHLFWIYILQRIPMIFLQYFNITNYPYIFLIISFVLTLIMAYYINILTIHLKKKIWNRGGIL